MRVLKPRGTEQIQGVVSDRRCEYSYTSVQRIVRIIASPFGFGQCPSGWAAVLQLHELLTSTG